VASAREVLLVTHAGRGQAVDAACRLARGLVDAGLRVRVPWDELTRLHEGANGGADLPLAPTDDTGLPPQCELVVVVGGDGTILRAAEYAVPAGIPLLGVNLGHVGFLAEVESDDVPDVVASVVNRAYAVEERLALAVRVLRDGHEVWSTWALNEATVEKASRQKMIDVLLEIEGHPLSRWGCDGVVVATPTGSTAYAWSIGGPVVWPGVQAMLVAPISAHALFARSLVVDPKNTVAVDLQKRSAEAVLWCDGRRVKHLLPGARVQVTSGDAPIRFARLHRSDFTDRLVAKFHLPVDGWRGTPA
jgi:NAD+ kinase